MFDDPEEGVDRILAGSPDSEIYKQAKFGLDLKIEAFLRQKMSEKLSRGEYQEALDRISVLQQALVRISAEAGDEHIREIARRALGW